MTNRKLKLKNVIILFDRDWGVSVFQNFRGYDDLVDDAEWLLERTPQKSKGFLIRPVSEGGREGIWIGEYNQKGNQIRRQDVLFDGNVASLNRLIGEYVDHKVSEKRFMEKIVIEDLRKKLDSRIVRDFKYYTCPSDRFYRSCIHIERIYRELTNKYGKSKKIPYSKIAEAVEKIDPCEDVIVCPLMEPNVFVRLLNLNKAFKSRKLGEIKFTDSGFVEIR
ncbi:hypothetical protein CW712_06415 [Candidatus Bathyarchaeota archaeon]|nr:MAG: hypothetical protein CW712_06415 [Candidatus Bathyarchaeota archaeon]